MTLHFFLHTQIHHFSFLAKIFFQHTKPRIIVISLSKQMSGRSFFKLIIIKIATLRFETKGQMDIRLETVLKSLKIFFYFAVSASWMCLINNSFWTAKENNRFLIKEIRSVSGLRGKTTVVECDIRNLLCT